MCEIGFSKILDDQVGHIKKKQLCFVIYGQKRGELRLSEKLNEIIRQNLVKNER